MRLREQQRRQRQNERMREKVKNEIILKVRWCASLPAGGARPDLGW